MMKPFPHLIQKDAVIVAVSALIIITPLTLSDCWAGKQPEAIKIKQSFKQGDTFYYQLTENKLEDAHDEEEKKQVFETFLYSLQVSSVNSDDSANIVITEKDGASIGSLEFARVWGKWVFPSRSIGSKVKIVFSPDGKAECVEKEKGKYVRWRELIIPNLPPKAIPVGGSYDTVHPLPENLADEGETKRKTTIQGFEEVNGNECVKVRVVSVTEGKGKAAYLRIESEKEMFLAFRKGFLVVKSHSTNKSLITSGTEEARAERTPTIREKTVELLGANVEKQWEKAVSFIKRGNEQQDKKNSTEAVLAYYKALQIFNLISTENTAWKPQDVKAKIEECNKAIEQIGKQKTEGRKQTKDH